MRLRAGARRGRVAQAGLVVPVGIGATRLRRPQSFTRPATVIGLAPVPRPLPRRRSGLALEPPLSRQRSGLALGTTTFAPAPRSALGATTLAGARPPLWHRAPGSGRFSRYDAATHAALRATTLALALCPPALGTTTPALAPRSALAPHSGAVPPLGAATLAGARPRSGVAPPVLGGFPAAMPRPTPPWGPPPLPWRRAPALCPALGVRDAKNRRFWSLAVKTDGFSRYRK